MNKRGISQVVTTMLIIVISIIAILVIWAAIRPLVTSTGERLNTDCINIDLNVLTCTYNTTADSVSVNVKRNPGEGDLQGLRLIFEKPGADSVIVAEDTPLDILESDTFTYSAAPAGDASGVDNTYTVSVAAIVGSQGKICSALNAPLDCN